MLRVNIAGVAHAYALTDNRPPETRQKADEAGNEVGTLVFVHGWLLSQAYWQPLVDALSQRYPCLTYDLRGFGASTSADSSPEVTEELTALTRQIVLPEGRSLPTDGTDSRTNEAHTVSAYSLAAYAQDLEALLTSLNIEKAWVLGHSLGGSVALWAAYLFPQKIQGVICINAGGGIYIPKEFETFRSAGQQMVKFRPNWLQHLPLLPRLFSRMMVRQPLTLAWGQQRIQDFIRADRVAAEGSLLETTTEAEVHLLPQVVRQLAQPVHFITATEDSIMPPRFVRYLASFHPHFEDAETVSEIAGCGHMAMVEKPAAVAEIVERVLADSTIP